MLRNTTTLQRVVLSLLGGAIAIGITFFLSGSNNQLLALATAYAITILGLSFLTGWSGQISLGHSGFMAIGGYVTALWLQHFSSTPMVITLILATAAAALGGVIMGLPATKLRGPYLAGMTLAFAVALPQLPESLGPWAGGSQVISLQTPTAPHWFANLVGGGPLEIIATNYQYDAILGILVCTVAFFIVSNLFASKTGRAMRLVRDNDVAAELVGLNLPRTRTLAFAISAALSGLGGAVFAYMNGTVSPASFPYVLSISLVTYMVLGGMGTLQGAVYGGLLAVYATQITNWISNTVGIDPNSNFGLNFQNILFGGLLIVTMITAPRGLAGLIHLLKGLVQKQSTQRQQ